MAGQPVATEVPVDLNAILNAPDIADGQVLKIDKATPKKVAVIEQKTPDPGIAFEKKQFIQVETTGIDFGQHREKKYSIENDTVRFSPELQAQFKNFLTTHVESLLRISNPQVLDNPQHIHEKKLLQALTKDGQLDKNALENFLKTSDGWAITSMLVENQTALKLFAAGLDASINPEGRRVSGIDAQTISLHADQSKLNYWLKERFGGWLTEQHLPEIIRQNKIKLISAGISEASLIGIGTMIGNFVGHPVGGALIGAGLIPGVATIAGGASSIFKDGIKIDLKRCGETLKALGNVPGEREYMMQVLGIDTENFVVNASGDVVKNLGHVDRSRPMSGVKNEIFQGLFLRRQFLGALGVPPNTMDALPEQFIFQTSNDPLLSPEQTGTHWSKRIEEKFDSNNSGGTEAEKLVRFMKARKDVMMEYLIDHLVKVSDNTESSASITRFQEKRVRKGERGAELAEKKVASDKKIAQLDKEKTELVDPAKAAEEYQEAQKNLEIALEGFKKDYPAKGIDKISTIIDQLNKSLDDVLTPGTIAFREKAIADAKENALNVALTNAANALPAKADQTFIAARMSSIEEAINKMYDPQLKRLEAESTKINEKITHLKAIKIQYENAQKVLSEKSQALLGYSGRINPTTIEANYNVIGGPNPNSVGITDAQLGILSIDELMVEINRVNRINNAKGWTEAGNNNPVNRQLVIDAVAEAKARLKEAIDPDKIDRDTYYNQITGWGIPPISDVQLRTLSRSQLLNLIHISNGAGNGGWAIGRDVVRGSELDKAIAEAKNRIILRYSGTVEERIKDLTNQAESERERMENISFKDDLDVLDVVGNLMDSQGKVFANAYLIASNSEQFTNRDLIAPSDPIYSQEEKEIGAPQGYWEIMDAMFGYKTKVDRNSYVPKMLKVFPPKALAREIVNSLILAGMPLPSQASNFENINFALAALNGRINSNPPMFNGFDTRRMITDIVNNLRAKADAI